MAEEPKLPPLLVEQIDKLYSILKSMPELLQIGRAYGLVVGLSPRFGGEIMRRHGEAAAPVLANVWRVDPASNINS